mgnify:CR=1 FL=1
MQGEAVVGLSLPGDVFFPSAWAVTSSIMISSQIYLPGLVNLLGLEAPESKDQAHGSEVAYCSAKPKYCAVVVRSCVTNTIVACYSLSGA